MPSNHPATVFDKIDEEGDGGVKLSAQSRCELMAKLSGGAGIGMPPPPLPSPQTSNAHSAGGPPSLPFPSNTSHPSLPSLPSPAPAHAPPASWSEKSGGLDISMQQGVLGPASPIPTRCVLLKNMFDPHEESEPNWAEDIGE